MTLSGTLGSLALEDIVGFLSTHGVEGVLTICGAAGASLQLLVLPGRLLIPETRSGRLSQGTVEGLLSRPLEVSRSRPRRLSRAQIDELMLRARDQRAASAAATRAPASGRLSRTVVQDLLARADALEPDVNARRHQAARHVHAVSSSDRARFEFTPCPVPDEVVRDLEALGGVAVEPLALLLEVARLADERRHEPSRAPTRAIRRAGAAAPAPLASLQGDIDGVGLAALLQTLRQRRRDGTLVLTAAGGEEQLHFVKGEAFALRVEADDEFAFALLGADAADSVRALVRGAAVEERALTAAEQSRLRGRFLDVLFGQGATFAFYEGEVPPDVHAPRRGITRIALQTERFLLEAIQRMVEWDELRALIDDGKAVLRFRSQQLKLEALRGCGASEVLTLLDGRLSFDEVVAAARASRLEAARAIAALVRAGVLQPCPAQ